MNVKQLNLSLKFLVAAVLLNPTFGFSAPVVSPGKSPAIRLALKKQTALIPGIDIPKYRKSLNKTNGGFVEVFDSYFILPNKKRIDITKPKMSRALASSAGIVVMTTTQNMGLSMRFYDPAGKELAVKYLGLSSDYLGSDSGQIIITDNIEGFGKHLYIYNSSTGEELVKAKPYDSGYESAILGAVGGKFIVATSPIDKKNYKPTIFIFNQMDGRLEQQFDSNISAPKSIKSDGNVFSIYESYLDPVSGDFESFLHVFNVDGVLINRIDAYAIDYMLDEADRSLIVNGRNSMKYINYEAGTILWEKKYSELYTQKSIVRPGDIPTGFNVYPLQILILKKRGLIAVNIGQSSFNPIYPKYEAEFSLLDKNTGDVKVRQYLGKKNIKLEMLESQEGIEIHNASGGFSYEILPK